MTITEFLLARIADDEWCAQHMAMLARDDGGRDDDDEILYEWTAFERRDGAWHKTARLPKHITPGRVLAECKAKRAIVGLHPEILTICQGCGESYPCRTLMATAAVYADHPDYDPDWTCRKAPRLTR